MTKASVAILLSAIAVSAYAHQRHVVIRGAKWSDEFKIALRSMLGPGSVVDEGQIMSLGDNRPPIDVMLYDLSYIANDWAKTPEHADSVIPRLRTALKEWNGNPRVHAALLIAPTNGSTTYEHMFAPLMRQVAREANFEVIDLSHSVDMARDLYLAITPSQRNPGTWRLISATSEQSDEGPAKNAIDNNSETYWHTRYDPNPTKVPHEIVIDLGKEQALTGFSYLARQDGGVNGRVKKFELYLSNSKDTWGKPVLKGELQNVSTEQRLLFPKPATGRYLRFRALSEVNGNIWTSVAEIGILKSGGSK